MIRALFFDLDGTLLSSGKKLLPSTVSALQSCRERGVRVYLATARSPRLDRTLGWTEAEFALFDGGLYCNGACIVHGTEQRYLYIDPDAARACIRQVARHPGIQMSLHMEGDLHAFNHHLPDHMLGPWGVTRGDILPLDEHALRHAVKILIYTDCLVGSTRPLPQELFPALQVSCGDGANLYLTDGGCTIQVASREASKHLAIEGVGRQLGLRPEEIAVFGDDLNDVEMLSHCPNSVAMGNAHPEVKAIAAHVTLSCDDDGVAHALKNILHLI
ncbi:MAG: HAD family hydrolase [Clostridiales bacterium]|nr:HAD family hydrolase [Clostridiales bacterium]